MPRLGLAGGTGRVGANLSKKVAWRAPANAADDTRAS